MKIFRALIVTGAVIILFPLYLAALQQQVTSASLIEGTVTDAETGEGISKANVYLANTTIGTTTDEQGKYRLKTSSTGVYKLIISFVGYEKKISEIQLTAGDSIQMDADLKPQVIEMEELKVEASNKEWKNNFAFFRKEFIGETEFAETTTIENPWIIDFNEPERHRLTASAPEPIRVMNPNLGYKLHLELIHFSWNKRSGDGAYKVFYRYETLPPKNKKQEKKWVKNREETYLGSFTHFLRSLYMNTLEEDKFEVNPENTIEPLSEGEKKFALLGKSGISSSLINELKGFKITRRTQVRFLQEMDIQSKGRGTIRVPIYQRSEIGPNTNGQLFFVFKNGTLLDPLSLKIFGDWAKNRIADSLPENYLPEN